MNQNRKPILVVGGGFTGAMVAARLAERGLASVLIDATGQFGPGVAYSTPFDGHLLNVRTGRMSALAGQPDHFTLWLQANHPEHADPEAFAPRRLYGLYVQDRLASVEAAHPGRITRVQGRAVRILGSRVMLADGRRLSGRAVVLATGNPAPATAGGGGDRLISDPLISDPWAPGALDAIGPQDTVGIIGTGLTMVDMVLWLQALGHRGRITALSRRGLKPRAHGAAHDTALPLTPDLGSGPVSRRLAAARRAARQHHWRAVMEGFRPVTAELWQAADMADRARFLRHLRPWWDVHRHRIAPQIAAKLDELVEGGRLDIMAARVVSVEARAGQVSLGVLPRGGRAPRRLGFDRVIDCSGPGHDCARDALTGPLLASGRARLDPLGLGLELDDAGRLVRIDGSVDEALFVVGPPARARFWETIAVPDIRERIEALADTLDPAERD